MEGFQVRWYNSCVVETTTKVVIKWTDMIKVKFKKDLILEPRKTVGQLLVLAKF